MATGRLPFQGGSSGLITEAILNRNPVAPARVNPDIPLALQQLIRRALEKDSNLRYQRAADMRVELQRLKRDIESGWITVEDETKSVATGILSRLSSAGKRRARTSSVQTAGGPPTAGFRDHRLACSLAVRKR
jgi:eukaryotic-like serine/threonine-protein kinase